MHATWAHWPTDSMAQPFDLREDFLPDLGFPFRPDEALLQALVGELQLPGIEAQEVQNGRLQVVDAHLAFGDEVAELVGGAERHAAFYAAAGQPDGEAVGVVV